MTEWADFSQLNSVTVDLGKVSDEAERNASVIVRKSLFDIESDTKVIIIAKDIIDTGDMLNSVGTDVDDDGLGGQVGPSVDYGIYNELGTSRMAPRPFLGPAFDRRVPAFKEALTHLADGITN